MNQRIVALVMLLVAFVACPVSATAPVPRKSPDLTITQSSGKQIKLSGFAHKVVAVEFLVTNCPHCLRVAQTLAKLQWELGSRGFQSIGIAFDKNITAEKTSDFAKLLAVSYPVGYTSSDKVDSYLGRESDQRFRTPQIVIIDRKGVIRAQSQPIAEKNLEDENYLRSLIGALLKEAP
ncbi:MAG TPA: TlpA disulfide reductase family protein [Blastocatellia bacterium]|nr:TlpA disulfide reductase family protein [Blastocatellia bacterium]